MTRLPKVKTTQTLALSVGVWRVQCLIILNKHAGLGAALCRFKGKNERVVLDGGSGPQ